MVSNQNNSEMIIYTAPDGTTKLQVQLEDDTVWLHQEQMAVLFGKDRTTINRHLSNIFNEEELDEKVVCAFFTQVLSICCQYFCNIQIFKQYLY